MEGKYHIRSIWIYNKASDGMGEGVAYFYLFTALGPMPIQSSSRNVRLFVFCLYHPDLQGATSRGFNINAVLTNIA